MARRRHRGSSDNRRLPAAPFVQNDLQSSLLDVVDNVLNRGAVLDGDVVLGVANVDLIYVKLSVLLAAFDKATKPGPLRRHQSLRKSLSRKKK